MAQTPPLPAHIPPPPGTDDVPGGSGETGVRGQDDDQSAPPGGLPRRQVTAPEERPPSMAAAAQALAGNRAAPPATQEQAKSAQPGLVPPVIPGAGGAGRSASTPIVPAGASRPTIPPAPSTPSPQPPGAAPSRPDPAPARPGTSGPEAAQTTTTGTGDARTTGADTTDAATTDADATSGTGPADTWSAGSGPGTGTGSGPGIGSGPGQDGPVGTAADSADSRTSFDDDFVPANEVERDLYRAVDESSTDSFLSTLLLATVLVPVASNSRPGSAPGESGFAFRTEEIDGDRFLVVFTSRDRLAEHFAEPTRTVGVRFVDLIRNWPDPAWSFAVNPTSPIGAKYPGPQVIALATWAVEAGLGGEPVDAPAPVPQPQPAEATAQLTMMQKAVPAEQVDYYLERGYDRVAGFVHRSGEVEHLRSPGDLFAALGLLYDGSPYQGDAKEAFVLRWPAHRPSLYRIPYGGQSEQALRAMDGWVIERPPFRGNGFAPGEGKDVIAEFKVDSVRLPHGAQLWRMDADGTEQMIAVFDCDAPVWRRVGEQ
ncbi:SseB family protein [Actinoplanes sp. NPDC049599]|uniref:SseB family protein n=1 Tax=Actinoplanes sp. NPDC049599 TaxID=3363903 RepID=UPI0037A42350